MAIEDRIIAIVYEESGKLTLEQLSSGGLRGECRSRIAELLDKHISDFMDRLQPREEK